MTCGQCRKTIPAETRARGRRRCPFCRARLTAAASPPTEAGVTVGRHASVRTPPPSDWLAAPRLAAPLPPLVRRRRRKNDTRIAVAILVLLGLFGLLAGVLPRFYHPRVGPTPPRQVALPTVVVPAPVPATDAPEPIPPTPQVAPVHRPAAPAEPAPEDSDPHKARFRTRVKSLEWLFGPPQDLTYSADCRHASFLSREDVIRVWDVDEPKELFCLYGGVTGVAFSPDGSEALAFDRHGTLYLWGLAACVELRRFGDHSRRVVFLSFSPDGGRALAGYEEPDHRAEIRMWDLQTGKNVADADAWRAAWVSQAAAVVAEPIWPACAGEAGPATFALQTLQVPRRPVEVGGGEPIGPPRYLLSTTTGRETTSEIVQVDDDR